MQHIEAVLEQAVFTRFGIEAYDKTAIKHADMVALFTERRDIMKTPPQEWDEFETYKDDMPAESITPLPPGKSEELFLERYAALTST